MKPHTWNAVLAVCAVVAILLLPCPSSAQVGTTGFDSDLSGNPIPPGQLLRYEFGTVGITLRGGGHPTCPEPVANDDHPGDFGTPPNVIGLCPPPFGSSISDLLYARIRAQFIAPVRRACIAVRPDTLDDYAVMWALDGGSQLVDESFSSPGEIETLCVQGRWIREVEFTGFEHRLVTFDDLSVDFGPVGGPRVRYLPGVANLPGAGGTRWRSDLEVTNRGGDEMTCRVELLVRDQANPDPDWRSFPVSGGQSVTVENVLENLFGFEGAATLRVIGTDGDLHVAVRTYNDNPAGTYGQFIGGVADHQAIKPGQLGLMTMLSQSPDDSQGYRTNLGLINPTSGSVRVLIRFHDSEGSTVAQWPLILDPYESTQIDRVLEVLAGGLEEGYIWAWSSTHDAHFIAYASVVDNRSGDGIYVPAVVN
jgi:hypothetical protein